MKESYIPALTDKAIVRALTNINRSVIQLVDSDGKNHFLLAEADCCSSSYFEGFVGFSDEAFIIKSVKALESYSAEPTLQEDDAIYPFVMDVEVPYDGGRTYKRQLTFVLRNSSNGYYGGSLGYDTGDLVSSWWTHDEDKWFPLDNKSPHPTDEEVVEEVDEEVVKS